MKWNEWLIPATKTTIKQSVSSNLVTTQYLKQNTDIRDEFWTMLFELLDNQFINRTLIIEDSDQMTGKAVNILTEKMPQFIEGLKKNKAKELLDNPENWGFKVKQSTSGREGSVPTDDFGQQGFLTQDANTSTLDNQQINYLTEAKNFANSYFWKTGLYDLLINSFAAYVVPFEIIEWA